MHRTHALGRAFWGRSLVSIEWRKLCYVSYQVDPALLTHELPPSVSLDLREEQAVVSLVLFEARYPSLLGVALPASFSSTEMALRYYVREGMRRGAVTVYEDSSSTLAALFARALFREPTRHTALRSQLSHEGEALSCVYSLERGGRAHHVRVRTRPGAQRLERDSWDEFVAQRPYGYQRSRAGELVRSDLDHPAWESYPVLDHELDLDFAALYGPSWAWLNGRAPVSVTLAEGSAVRASLPT